MWLPEALPDEILFSRLCRHYTLSGCSAKNYLKSVFNNVKISVHPYLPAKLSELSQICHENPRELWKEQTLLPLFAHYLPVHRKSICDLNMSPSKVFRACQIPSFKERDQLSLKYCTQCARENVYIYGVAYWNRSHQIPGIEACYKHGIWLEHQDLKPRPHIAPGYFPSIDRPQKACPKMALNLAKYCHVILQKITNGSLPIVDPTSILNAKGYITIGKRLRRKLFAKDCFSIIEKLEYSESKLVPVSKSDLKYWSSVIRNEASQHPFKHLLFGFCIDQIGDASERTVKRVCRSDKSQDVLINDLCCKLLLQGVSMTKVSRKTGKSCCYVKSLALRNSIPITQKPKYITQELIQIALKMAYKGFHRKVIASHLKISLGSVEMIISAELGLVERRRRYKSESLCRRYKVQLIRFLEQHPGAIRAEVKGGCEAAFYWMYLHQPIWLEENLPKPKSPKRVNFGSR